MENIFLTSLTTPEVRQIIRQELEAYFDLRTQNQPIIQEEQQFTIEELAKYLKCSKATVHSYKKRGIFRYYQTGRTVYFKKSEVDAALEVNGKIKR